ncbi:MAG TPA: hypothetical protein VMP01_07190 [Pirellulaceae bacterium]|nr:hypothetical protein [Pirellulaceae bacterium]
MSRALTAIVLSATLCLSACSRRSDTADAKPVDKSMPVAAKADKPERPKIPDASDQKRQELVAELDAGIMELEAHISKLISLEAQLPLIDPSNPNSLNKFREDESTTEQLKAVEKHHEREQKMKVAREETVKQLVECREIRTLATLTPDRHQGLVERIIDRYREKRLPMYDREYVAEKVGNRADQPAVQLARDVSNKVVYGWYERYDPAWMVNDANAFTKQRIDEIIDELASQIR